MCAENTNVTVRYVTLTTEPADPGWWVAEWQPGIASEGKSVPEALRNLAEAIECAEASCNDKDSAGGSNQA